MIEFILVILLLAIFVVLLQHKNRTADDLSEVKNRLDKLQQRLDAQPPSVAPPYTKAVPFTPVADLDEALAPEEEELPYVPLEEPVVFVAPAPVQDIPLPSLEDVAIPEEEELEEENVAAFTATPSPSPEPTPSFWEKNPDLEKFIGENLFNKIGIAILVIGIGFFLKFAIDENWINEIGRTFIGFLCGGILITLAHRMRKSFAAFSSVLIGGGVSVLYFTIAIAFHQYHLIGQTAAFLLTVLITSFTVLLSIQYDRKELAVLAILGGFSAPFMVSTGKTNEVVFFSYLLILNMGMLVLAYYKKWNIVNIICYVATILLFGSWLTMEVLNDDGVGKPPYGIGLLFASLYYLVFFAMNVVNNVRRDKRFGAIEISILLSNTFLYYSAGMVLLHAMSGNTWQGLFTALLAVFNCLFAYILFRNSRVDRTLIFLLIGLVLTFISLAVPVQLEGNYITLFWSAEAVLIFWLYRKSRITQMKYASMLVLGLMIISLLMDWEQLYGTNTNILIPVINKAFITSMVSVAAVYLLILQIRKEEGSVDLFPAIPASRIIRILQILFIVLLYVSISLEIWYQFGTRLSILTVLMTGSFNFLYLGILLRLAKKEGVNVRQLLMVLALTATGAYLVVYNPQIIDVRLAVLTKKLSFLAFLFHYVLLALLLFMLVPVYKILQQPLFEHLKNAFNWFAATLALYLLSAELDHITVLMQWPAQSEDILEHTHRTGYAILWGVYAFALMFLGLRKKSKHLRIIAIAVFAITLLKLFIFDLAGLGEGGKIAAFISLGILLLLISFMYQRLKEIILTDNHPVNNEEKVD